MTDHNDAQDLVIEDEEDDVPFVEFDISASPSDLSLELIVQQVQRDDIIIPFYQRKYVWKIEQASKLIESFLLGLPVPQVFLYINDDAKLEVIDGHQRIMSVKYFFDELFGEPDAKDRQKIFKLKGLSERSEYNGKKFSELTDRDKRRLRNSTLRAINIKQLSPEHNNESVFHIFERLNTGGTQLNSQEIRNAVYRGPIVNVLALLNTNEHWRNVLGSKKPHKNQKDIELILRLFSLFEVWHNYEKPMLQHLNVSMGSNRKFDTPRALLFKERFPIVTRIVDEALEKPFRPKHVLNAGVLEAVMVTLLESPEITVQEVKDRYPVLLKDEIFVQHITQSTTDTLVLKSRLERAKNIFDNAEV